MSQQTKLQLQNGPATITSSAFAKLHGRYRGRLVNSITALTRNREEAEDITATAFAAAFRNLDTFRGDSSPQTWIHAIALNEMRSRRRGRCVPLESIEEFDVQIAEPDERDEAFEKRVLSANLEGPAPRSATLPAGPH